MIVHKLNGCAPAPLAHYLKALRTLRLVAEQADPEARGWWEGERFLLATHLDEDDLLGFFLERYEPTPLVAPWNGGTGFYPKDKKAGKAVSAILHTKTLRFAEYRRAIQDAKKTVTGRKEAPEKKEKETLIAECRRTWRGGHSRALSAAIVLSEDGKPSYPSLFGTGLNDGRLDFSSNFMGRLLHLFPNDGTAVATTLPLLMEALTGSPTLGMQAKAAIGQFHPGNAGGNNASTATDVDPLSNAWYFLHPGTWYGFGGWPELNAQIVGGGARGHDKIHPFDVKALKADHPVMKDIPASFTVEDELYYVNAEGTPEGTAAIEVLAETSNSDKYQKPHPSVWITKHPKAKIVGLALGHDARTHDLKPYQQLLINAAKWVSGK